MICFLDLETTGIPAKNGYHYPPPYETSNYDNSRMIEIAYVIANITQDNTANIKEKRLDIISSEVVIIKHDGFVINNSEIHGITQEECDKKGVKIQDFLNDFEKKIRDVEFINSYNIEFDFNILLSECYRVDNNLYELLKKKQTECIMILSKNFMKVDKYPKLQETYNFLFGKKFEQKHRALDDTETSIKCYCKIKGIKYPNSDKDTYIPEFKESENKIYLDIPYCRKEEGKKLGCKWDPNMKKWYMLSSNNNQKEILNIFMVLF